MARLHDLQFAKIDCVSAGGNTVISNLGAGDPVRAGYIYVVNYSLVATGAVTIQWFSTGTALSGVISLAANTGLSATGGDINTPILRSKAVPNADLVLNLGGAVQVSGHIVYYVDNA